MQTLLRESDHLEFTLNGACQRLADENPTIADLLVQLNINPRYCAVERNAELIPREQHKEVVVREGDRIEIVTLVGGG